MDAPVVLTGNPNLPKGERTTYRHFRTEVVRPPEPANFGIGNAPRDPIRGPGIDSSQFAGRHTGGRWDAQGRQARRPPGSCLARQEGFRFLTLR